MNILSHIGHFFLSLTRPKPSRDWFFALICIFLMFVCLVSYAIYIYVSINSGAAFSSGAEGTAPVISLTRADVQSILETYRARSVNYVAHNLPMPVVTDPAK